MPRKAKKTNVGVLRLKIARPYGMPTSRFEQLLHLAARLCAMARNAAVTNWYTWRITHPDWKPGDYYEAPAPKIKVKEKPLDPEKPQKDPDSAPRLFWSRAINDAAGRAAEMLNRGVVSACVQQIQKYLHGKVPYTHKERGFKSNYRWEAILCAEDSIPNYRSNESIPMLKATMQLVYSDDECSIRIPLLSRQSGYRTISPRVRLHCSDLKTGHRRILRQLADGTLPLCDSQLNCVNGVWYAYITYQLPTNAVNLPRNRILFIEPGCDKRPFVLKWMENGEEMAWDIGNGIPLVNEYRRVQARRMAIRHRGYKGHGVARQERTTRPLSRYVTNLADRFKKQTIAAIIRKAIDLQCGSIIYRTPTQPVKDKCWFGKNDMPMDWTAFEGHLSHRCHHTGLEYDTEHIGLYEWQGKDKPRKTG